MRSTERIKPFQAIHYNLPIFKDLRKLACPPYDVISKEEQGRLKRLSPYNFSHILLKSDNASYRDLGDKFRSWLRSGILTEDKDAAFYLTSQEFKIGRGKFKRCGFLGLLKLDEDKVVFPHERTHTSPKKDRFQVLKQAKTNLSPIFVIYPSKGREPLITIITRLSRTRPFLEVVDSQGVSHKVWKLTDKKDVRRISEYFKKVPLLIADGHHRFEVARAFFNKNKANLREFKDLNYILTYFSPQDENLVILPTHRVLKKKFGLDWLLERLEPYFFMKKFNKLKNLENYLGRQRQFSFGFCQNNNIFSLSLKDKAFLDKIPKRSGIYKNLDTFLLHNWVFTNILKIKVREEDIIYTNTAKFAKIQAEKYHGCGFIMRPSRIEDVMGVAFKGLKLPQKTTYFYPKFLSGLILRKLY